MKPRRKRKFGLEMAAKDMVAVGRVEPNRVRLWLRSEHPGECQISVQGPEPGKPISGTVQVQEGNPDDNTLGFWFPTDSSKHLDPLTLYEFSITRVQDGRILGTGRFQTAPASPDKTPAKFAFAIVSCHQPFSSVGLLQPDAMVLWRVLAEAFQKWDVKFAILTGDQIYSDEPDNYGFDDLYYTHTKVRPDLVRPNGEPIPIFEWKASDVRDAFQKRYRIFWSMEEAQRILAEYPCYYIFDDHEVIDDWGSKLDHAEPGFHDFKSGALQAYCDYQASRVGSVASESGPFDYAFEYGNVAFFVFDLRSERRGGGHGRLFSDEQYDRFEQFLKNHGDKHALFIVTSVPVIHLPEIAVQTGLSDLPDHWGYGRNRLMRDRVLRVLFDHQERHPDQRIAFLGGDVHIGVAFGIHWTPDQQNKIYQFTSSAVSNKLRSLDGFALQKAVRLLNLLECKFRVGDLTAKVELLRGENTSDWPWESDLFRNPFSGLNVGIIEVEDKGHSSSLRYRMVSYSKNHRHPKEKWVSKPL